MCSSTSIVGWIPTTITLSGELHAIPVQVAIVCGLTLEGEQELLEDPDERAF
jgi:hypothetical protein